MATVYCHVVTMSGNVVIDFESAPIASTGLPTAQGKDQDLKDTVFVPEASDQAAIDLDDGALGAPSEEDLLTLRKISAPMP